MTSSQELDMSNKHDVPGKEATNAIPFGDGSTAPLPPEVQELIGRQLRRVYSGLVEAQIPDNFSSLLDRLSTASAAPKCDTEQDT